MDPLPKYTTISGNPISETDDVSPAPTPASLETVNKRLQTCTACPSWTGKCTVAGCGCSGAGFLERALSRCPVGKWDPEVPPRVDAFAVEVVKPV